MSPRDPSWIGAWWLGYILCAAAIFIAAMPMFFYPKRACDDIKEVKNNKKEDETLLEQAKRRLSLNKCLL